MFPAAHGVVSQLTSAASPEPGGLEVVGTAPGGAQFADTHTIPLPPGEGGLLLLVLRTAHATQEAGWVTPDGWVKAGASDPLYGELAVLYRHADGSEGETVNVDLTDNAEGAWVAYRVAGAALGAGVQVAFADLNVADPPPLTPAWGAADTLWIAVDSRRRGDVTFTAPPDDYTGLSVGSSRPSGSQTYIACLATAHRIHNTSTENPGAFSSSGALSAVRSATIGVRPA